MNKIEFAELNKDQMIIAFNQLKDDYSQLFNELEEKEEQMNIMSEAFDELEHQKQDYTQINILEMQLEEKDKIIDEAIKYTNHNFIKKVKNIKVEKLLEILERGKNGMDN